MELCNVCSKVINSVISFQSICEGFSSLHLFSYFPVKKSIHIIQNKKFIVFNHSICLGNTQIYPCFINHRLSASFLFLLITSCKYEVSLQAIYRLLYQPFLILEKTQFQKCISLELLISIFTSIVK